MSNVIQFPTLTELEFVKLALRDFPAAFRYYVGDEWVEEYAGTVFEEIRKGEMADYLHFLVNNRIPQHLVEQAFQELEEEK